MTAIAARLNVPLASPAEIDEIKKDVAPEAVLDEITAKQEED